MKKHNRAFAMVGVYFAAVFVGIVVAQLTGATEALQTNLRVVLLPAQQVESSLFQQLSMPIESLSRYWKRSQDIAILEKANVQLQVELQALSGEQTENEQFVPVVSYPYRFIRFGAEDGAKVDQLVLVQKTLVGRISSVGQRASQVKLLSDSGVAAIVAETNNGQRGIVLGKNDSLRFTEVPQTALVSQGDRVMTAGQEGVEQGLLVGTVGQELSLPTDSVRTFELLQTYSFDTADKVEIR